MLVLIALAAYFVGQVACVGALTLTTIITLTKRHPAALVPATLAGLWIAGTVDVVDYFDGPMRLDADANMLGTGRGVPSVLSGPSDGPVWWIPTAAAACMATFTLTPKIPNLRVAALIGLTSLTITYAGLGAINAMS